MTETNEAGFDGSANIASSIKLKFRNGYDILQLKEYLHYQPYNEFFWCKRERVFLYRNKDGEFFKLNFEKIEL